MMKLRRAILSIAMAAVFALAFLVLSRPSGVDFCSGTSKVVLSAIQFDGQGRRALLSDPASLSYLASVPKLKALPSNLEINDGYAFEAELRDYLGRIGTVSVLISSNAHVIRLDYFESLFSDVSFSYLTIESNAPANLRGLIAFLAKDSNRGRMWTDIGVSPLNVK